MEARHPHLRSVPAARANENRVAAPRHAEPMDPTDHLVEETAEVLGAAEQARDGGAPTSAPAATVHAGMRGLGESEGEVAPSIVPEPTLPEYAVVVGRAMVGGGVVGGLAAGSWEGARIGILTNVALTGVYVVTRGAYTPKARIVFGVLALVAAGSASYLLWRRMR